MKDFDYGIKGHHDGTGNTCGPYLHVTALTCTLLLCACLQVL